MREFRGGIREGGNGGIKVGGRYLFFTQRGGREQSLMKELRGKTASKRRRTHSRLRVRSEGKRHDIPSKDEESLWKQGSLRRKRIKKNAIAGGQ